MKVNFALVGAFLVGFALPAPAQTSTTSYYVVQDVKTKKCTIVDKRPTTTTTITQVGPVAFKSRTEAEAGMTKEKICVEK